MKIKKMTKPSLWMFLASTAYYFVAFLVFAFIADCAIRIWYESGFVFTKKNVTDLLVISGIVGLAAGSRTWLFAWLDERKARKSPPPSDPKP
ncbi:hypothetical protein RKT74_00255 [Leclercia pneumoniae]|uniref:hypothetical protein n=1 Tax=Leclercia TaxID=83654 RepID=UPI001BACBDD1|nr:hypothetical protein [Leclercia pneumoniae]MBS0853259.1 hypothetical protein [Enterobacter sp. JGM127]MCV2513956.1 hypothetical protein [Leclercia pneumoniae]WNN81293.1 hypothetical protein RKT74_00255 [Leclercia pneumoniae]